MKIGLNARFLAQPYSGIGQYTRHLIQALAPLDEKNEYFLFTPKLVDLLLPENFHQIRVPEKKEPSTSLSRAQWEFQFVPQEMKRLGIELAHFLYPAHPGQGFSLPSIVTVHDVIPWVIPEYRAHLRSRLYHAYVARGIKKTDHLITVSDFSKKEVQKLFKVKNKKCTPILLGPTLNQTPSFSCETLTLRRPFLLYVGGYDPRKNVPLLIEAFQKFVANSYALDLVLVGAQGHDLDYFLSDQYQEKVAGKFPLKPKGSIIFTPLLSPDALQCLYQQATAFVHASAYEGFNLPLLDALAAGLPILVSDLPVHREVAEEAAFFAPIHSVDAFGLALHEFLNHPHLKFTLKKEALERAKDFSWEKCAQKTLKLYQSFKPLHS